MQSSKLIRALGVILLLSTATFGQTLNRTTSGQPEIYFVPDVTAQFNQLALRPDALAFGKDGQPNPDLGKHYQGIVRKHGPGTPYMFLSLNGNDSDCVFCNDEAGHLQIIKMESRDINGERMRSNRLVNGWAIASVLPGGILNPWPTPPDPREMVRPDSPTKKPSVQYSVQPSKSTRAAVWHFLHREKRRSQRPGSNSLKTMVWG